MEAVLGSPWDRLPLRSRPMSPPWLQDAPFCWSRTRNRSPRLSPRRFRVGLRAGDRRHRGGGPRARVVAVADLFVLLDLGLPDGSGSTSAGAALPLDGADHHAPRARRPTGSSGSRSARTTDGQAVQRRPRSRRPDPRRPAPHRCSAADAARRRRGAWRVRIDRARRTAALGGQPRRLSRRSSTSSSCSWTTQARSSSASG